MMPLIRRSLALAPALAWTVVHPEMTRYPGGEVVGSTGKVGSYILHRLNSEFHRLAANDEQYPQSLNAAAVPRGVAPGCLSPDDTPIFACTPASSIADVWDSTLPHRRKDLVFMCNCVPSRHLAPLDPPDDITIAILHFGVSHHGDVSLQTPTPRLNQSPQSPPTVIYGRHAKTLGELLQRDGVSIVIARSPREVQVAAAKKLAWSSLLWLLCHSDRGGPMPVKDVHRSKSDQLRRLVEEFLPSLDALALESWARDDGKSIHDVEYSRENRHNDDIGATSIGTVQDVLDYLRTYSMSISNGSVIPSRDLALHEINERNGLLLSLMMANASENGGQKNGEHINLIRQVAGEEILDQCLEANTRARDGQSTTDRKKICQRIKCASSNLEFLFHPNDAASHDSNTAKSVLVIGAGIVGSSIACHLSMRGVKVTVMDQKTNLLPHGDGCDGCEHHDIDPGVATSSSFGWLNANDKSPLSYKQFNQLGMEVWRRHDVLKHTPIWCGSLIRSARRDGEEAVMSSPHYLRIGPLELEEARRLEPGVGWPPVGATKNSPSEIFFYPEEGHVDPLEAVKELRSSARRNGVDFLGGVQINNLIRDETGKVGGVEYTTSHSHNINSAHSAKPVIATADIVVIAAGANSSNPVLGIGPDHLQMLDRPGVLAYALSSHRSEEESPVLKRIFVDTVAQTHMLRRTDRTIVIGGGQLVVGGKEDKSLLSTNTQSCSPSRNFVPEEDDLLGRAMVENAVKAMLPLELQPLPTSSGSGFDLVRVSRANRPVPYDGLPVVGFAKQGLYVAVTHSGITMAPLLGELCAYEIWCNKTPAVDGYGMGHCGFQILDDYRPSQSRNLESPE
jgi:glycine/D-amino acid oxidase-like deaminating enzyme